MTPHPLSLQVKDGRWRGRRCWTLTTDQLQLVITQWGAQLAEIILVDPPTVSPLWIPPWPTMDGDSYEPAVHGRAYGDNSESRLLSSISGHNLCFPFWGDPTKAEYEAGMSFHGEANLSRWELEAVTGHSIRLGGLFHESNLRMSREISLQGNEIRCTCLVTNLSAWDRPVAWCEHVTFGPPFLQPGRTTFDASVSQGFKTGYEQDGHFLWPQGKGEIECDLSTCGLQQHRDLVNSFLIREDTDHASFQARNDVEHLEVEYRFLRCDFPWLNIWENNDSRMLTRGMEFSNTPRHGTMKALIKTAELLDTPVYDWIEGKGQLRKCFQITLRRI